jgi:hypothetical protein
MLLATKSSKLTPLTPPLMPANPFDASSDASEPLIAAGDAEEEEDHRLEEKVFSRFKFYSLLLGLLVGFFSQFFALGVDYLLITMWGEDVVTKSKTAIFVINFFCIFFCLAIVFVILGFLRNRAAITYSVIGGRSKGLPEEMALHIEYHYDMGALVGIVLAWTVVAVRLGMRAQAVYSLVALLVALFWCKVHFHKYQAVIVSPIDGGTTYSMMVV